MRRLRLGIDLDGVVVDFASNWIRLYNADFGTDLEPSMATTWGSHIELTHFRTGKEFWEWARTADGGRSIFRNPSAYPGALEALARLAAKHRVVIVTSKPRYAIHDTYHWLAENRVPTTEVHIVNDKSTVDCDVFLDDGDHNLTALRRGRPAAIVCRYEQPWNNPHEGVIDVDAWDAFEAVVTHLARS